MVYNFDYYRIFYSVAKNKNTREAAKEIYLSQPTISRNVQKLEEELGCSLFVRTKKGMELTPEGELLYHHLSEMFAQLGVVEERLKQIKDLKNGMIHICAAEMPIQYFLLPYLEKFKKDYPGIRVKLSVGLPDMLMNQLNSGQVDFAVFTTPLEVDDTITMTLLEEYEDILIVGEKNKHLTEKECRLKELAQEPFILMRTGTTARNSIDQYFRDNQVEIHPEYEVSTMPVIVPMVQADMGIGFVPPFYAQEQLEKGTVYKLNLKEKLPQRQICLCTSNVYPQSAASKEFIKRLLK